MTMRTAAAIVITAAISMGAVGASAKTRAVAPMPSAYGFMGRSYLGVNVSDVSSDRVAALKLKEERGVEVTLVDQDSPAGKAGMKEHDVILDFNGNRVEGTEQLTRMIHETPAGRMVALGISRDGQPMQIKVTLGDRGKELSNTRIYRMAPHIMAPNMPDLPEMPDMPNMPDFNIYMSGSSASAGAMVDNLTPQLGEFFGVKNGSGVLVRSVEKGSAAESAGMRAGDVIVKVEGEKIDNRSDWRRALRARKAGKVAVTVVRDKREQALTLTLPEPKQRDSSDNREFTIEVPEVDIDIANLDAIENIAPIVEREMIKVRPQIEREMQRMQPEIEREMQRVRPEIEREMKELRKELERSLKSVKVEVRT